MDCSTPGFPFHQQLPELTQFHVHWIGGAIQPSYPLPFLSLHAFNLSHHQSIFQWVSFFFASGGQSIGVSDSTSVLPMNAQDWPPLGWTGWISLQSKGLSRVSNTTVKSINSSALSSFYSSTLTSIHDHWKNHSFDQIDICWQSNVSAFQYAIWVGHNFSSKE